MSLGLEILPWKVPVRPPQKVGLALRLPEVWEQSGAVFSGLDINNTVYAVSTPLALSPSICAGLKTSASVLNFKN